MEHRRYVPAFFTTTPPSTPASKDRLPGTPVLAVTRILGDGERKKTQAFSEIQSHSLFADKFGRPGRGNDKGAVENLVGCPRRNFMVPIPHAVSWEELNAHLEADCRERRIRQARFPVVKSLDSFDFLAIPSLNKALVLELARCEFLARKENLLLLGNSGTGKTHVALALGLAACQSGHRVRFTTAAALLSELIEARDEKHLLRFQKQLAAYDLLIVDELDFVPLSKTGAELLFELVSQRYERTSVLVPSNLPFDEWTEIFGSERLTGALLDRLTHHVHILEMNGDSYRLKQSRRKRNSPSDR